MRNKIHMATNNIFTKIFPHISQWVDQGDLVEIGLEENTDSLVRALDEGGLVWESTDGISIDEALQALDNFLAKYFEENE